jgi:salicylate hydroxylase
MRVLVVGAGIGGLTAALALRESGFDAHVYEQARVLREVGAGLALGPNAVRVLHRLGLAQDLRAVGVRSGSWDFRDWQSGAVLGRVPLAEAAETRWGAPFYNVHRADLHDALRSAVGDQHITLGAYCVSVEQHGSEVAISFADGRQATGDVVIGADGVHSVVREYVAGPDEPTWWPQIAWRGLVPAAMGREVGLELRQHIFVGPQVMFVTYFVSAGRLVNWIGCTPSDGWREESWSARGDSDEALALFEGWHPQVRALIAVRPVAARVVDAGPGDAVGRCRPPDAAVHGTGRRPSHRGRVRGGALPRRRSRASPARPRRVRRSPMQACGRAASRLA